MIRHVLTLGLIAALGAASLVGWQFVRSQQRAEVYHERLVELKNDYEQLRHLYNEAVTRTAVTELIVHEGKLAVQVRTVEGVQKRVETPYDPAREIYVDYVVVDGRLWIRRVFDARTAPEEALVIDPLWGEVDWSSPAAAHGKAVYRRLEEGRWVVTVTGDGSLGLARCDGESDYTLTTPPPVRAFEPMVGRGPQARGAAASLATPQAAAR